MWGWGYVLKRVPIVELVGLEPTRTRHQILSLGRLPIPPQPELLTGNMLLSKAIKSKIRLLYSFLYERETGHDPATFSLGSWLSTNWYTLAYSYLQPPLSIIIFPRGKPYCILNPNYTYGSGNSRCSRTWTYVLHIISVTIWPTDLYTYSDDISGLGMLSHRF